MAIIDHVRPASADRGRGRVIITSQEMKAERISVYSTRLIYSKVSNEISNKLILTSLHSNVSLGFSARLKHFSLFGSATIRERAKNGSKMEYSFLMMH